MVCVLSTPMERECGGNATDFVCSAHLLQFTLYGNTVFNTLWYLFECAVCKVCGGVLGILALRVQGTLHS